MALSELHIALIGAGVTGVLIVWGYNIWQDRKHRRMADRIFNGGNTDPSPVLPNDAAGARDERQEPRIDSAPAEDEIAAQAAQGAPEDGPAGSALSAPVPPASAMPSDTESLPAEFADPIADCCLRFSSASPIAAPFVHDIQRGWPGEFSKPLHWLARGGDVGAWQRVADDSQGNHREWAVSLQLVDRRGAIDRIELSQFIESITSLAQEVGARLDSAPDIDEVAANASALDQFCAGVDIQFVLHVVDATGGTFAGTKLRGLAEAAGMALESDGLFHARDEAGGEMFSMGNLGTERFDAEGLRGLVTHGVTFSIDVPRVSDGTAAFERMLDAARQITGALGGVLVDAQRAPLADAMIAAIRAKIIELQQRMRDGGIDPGSTRARRLFS